MLSTSGEFLRYLEERYGVDLVRELGETSELVTSEGTIYPLLSRLRLDGLVDTSRRDSDAGPPRRPLLVVLVAAPLVVVLLLASRAAPGRG